jgi:hypothetical protein
MTACSFRKPAHNRITLRDPGLGLVIWYSQTGHTRRIGRLIQQTWQKAGLIVDGGCIFISMDFRQINDQEFALKV